MRLLLHQKQEITAPVALEFRRKSNVFGVTGGKQRHERWRGICGGFDCRCSIATLYAQVKRNFSRFLSRIRWMRRSSAAFRMGAFVD